MTQTSRTSKGSPLEVLAGHAVTNVVELHDYVQLHFGDDIGILIYNDIAIDPAPVRTDELVGNTVKSVSEHANAIKIRFLDRTVATIDMHRQAYRGPEALGLDRRGYPPVIWN